MAGFGQGYVGTSEDVQRIRRNEKKRNEQRKKFEELQKQTKERVEKGGLRQFGASTMETLEHAFKNETIGLVTKAEFVQKRTTLQERLEEELRKKAQEEEDLLLKEKEKRKRDKQLSKPKLSFLADDNEEQEEDVGIGDARTSTPEPDSAAAVATPPEAAAAGLLADNGPSSISPPAAKRPKFGKFGKDPSIATDFLPDKDRDKQEEELRNQLKREWQQQQERLKGEPLEITYSYWDGQGHRRKIVVKKGDSISTFLKAVRDQLAPEFRELRAVSVDNLMYVKEDLILPHHHTFYDLIVNKARGKSGPLFNFSVHEDVRVVNDATVEKTDSHAGKVVERHWYDRNKHIFPASRWEVYDPDKLYDKYTIHGD